MRSSATVHPWFHASWRRVSEGCGLASRSAPSSRASWPCQNGCLVVVSCVTCVAPSPCGPMRCPAFRSRAGTPCSVRHLTSRRIRHTSPALAPASHFASLAFRTHRRRACRSFLVACRSCVVPLVLWRLDARLLPQPFSDDLAGHGRDAAVIGCGGAFQRGFFVRLQADAYGVCFRHTQRLQKTATNVNIVLARSGGRGYKGGREKEPPR